MTTKQEVEAAIYNMSGEILMGKADEKEIEKDVRLAQEHGLLELVKQEFGDINKALLEATDVQS